MSFDQALVHHLQRCLMADAGLSWEDVQPDDDGDVCFIDEHDRLATVRIIVSGSVTWARVWVVAARGLKRSAKLMREVNELNLSLVGARAMLSPPGLLILAGEIALESVEAG